MAAGRRGGGGAVPPEAWRVLRGPVVGAGASLWPDRAQILEWSHLPSDKELDIVFLGWNWDQVRECLVGVGALVVVDTSSP